MPPARPRFEGTLTTWHDERGFGFVQPEHGGDPLFVHVKGFRRVNARPRVGQRISFEVEVNAQGKKRARAVEPVVAARARAVARGQREWGTASGFAVLGFVALYLVVAILWRVPNWVAGAYVAASVVACFVYAIDKSAAVARRRRVPESTLHALALIGGWPGAIVAQQWLRHKSSKAAFRSTFWRTVAANVVAFVVLSSPIGRGLLGG